MSTTGERDLVPLCLYLEQIEDHHPAGEMIEVKFWKLWIEVQLRKLRKGWN
jgi:hypothetical protein